MEHASSLIALALSLAAMGVGAFLLRNAVKDASDLASALPTRPMRRTADVVEVGEGAGHRLSLVQEIDSFECRGIPRECRGIPL